MIDLCPSCAARLGILSDYRLKSSSTGWDAPVPGLAPNKACCWQVPNPVSAHLHGQKLGSGLQGAEPKDSDGSGGKRCATYISSSTRDAVSGKVRGPEATSRASEMLAETKLSLHRSVAARRKPSPGKWEEARSSCLPAARKQRKQAISSWSLQMPL